ncbi:BQ2448_6743 [Microbotryum intermedium]|uniref:BQ2448_6743 protein n=1 Tax=Microbotryum intermedium TaxID=269621 RepID=A0A238FQ36_9BASI|nr:BQ2448_6743 [Microbotryum intermedium]
MGIQGLLGMLKEIQTPTHVSEYKGKTLAVDAYVWLHRGAYGCAQELATGVTTLKYVNYAMHRVRMLKHYGVTPLIVFDGGYLPSKMGTEEERESRRSEALAKGNACLAEGKLTQAREAFVKAVDVTPAMAYQLIKYIVAPYEADPQLAYLEREGIVDGIITEDSDLLIFGCRTVLFKLDGEGHCVAIERARFSQCREYNFAGWGDDDFRHMAILSGCDYLHSVVGLGLKTAYKLLKKYKTPEKVIQFVRLEGNLTVPRDYLDQFKRAEMTFLHQRVFCPHARSLIHFTPLPPGITDAATELPFVGAPLDEQVAQQLAEGEIDPITKEPIVDLNPSQVPDLDADTPHGGNKGKAGFSYQRKSAAPIPVAKGKSSILNFFNKEVVASTSKPEGAKPKVGNKTSRFVTQSITTTTLTTMTQDKTLGDKVSRFFGGGSKKGKAKEVEIVEVDGDGGGGEEVMIIDEAHEANNEEAEIGGEFDDDEGMAAMRECEMESVVKKVSPRVPRQDRPLPIPASSPECMSSPAPTPAQLQACDIPPPSDVGVSSPPENDDSEQDEAANQCDEHDDEFLPPLPALLDGDAMHQDDDNADFMSSPVTSPIHTKAISKPAPHAAPKVERGTGMKAAGSMEKIFNLSSDPIGLSSDLDEDATPQPRANQGFKIFEDARPAIAAPSNRKKRPSQESVEDEVDDEQTSVASVIGSMWRSKYMLPVGNKAMKMSTPIAALSGRKPISRTTTTFTSVNKRVSASKGPTPTTTKHTSSTSKSIATPARVPLSPRKFNRMPAPPSFSSSPAPPKALSSGGSTLTTSASTFKLEHKSSSPVMITNPSLLKWRFQGAVGGRSLSQRPIDEQENA